LSQGKVLFEHIPIEKQKRSAAEPQPKDDRIGFAASSQQAAKPLPKSCSEKQESKNLLRSERLILS
jgi:hypothetical protein